MVDHPLRRKDRALSPETCEQLLVNGEYCVLATVDAEQWPYATPLSYVYMSGVLYFHCAHEGHKVANIKENPHCSVAVIGRTQPVYAHTFTTYYESVVVFGTASEVTEPDEKTRVLTAFAKKYLPEHMEKAESAIAASLSRTAVYALCIKKMTGKTKKAQESKG